MEQESMQNRKPMLLMMAGPNGSGKSTLTQFVQRIGRYTNADDIVAATGMSNEDAAILVDKIRYDSINKRKDFTFETVLSSKYKLEILRAAKDAGYFIKCIFVLTNDPRTNLQRVESRVASGGHAVNQDKIISRYYKSLSNVKELMNLCDILHVYDNTDKPFRIIRKHKDDISWFENQYWDSESILRLMRGNISSDSCVSKSSVFD